MQYMLAIYGNERAAESTSREQTTEIVNAYMDWCTGKTVKNKAVIVFDTMWGSTDKMARAIGEGIATQGVEVKLLKLRGTDNTDIVTEIVDAKQSSWVRRR